MKGKKELFDYMVNFPKHFQVKFTDLYFHSTEDPALVIAEFKSDGKALSTGKGYLQKYISVVRTTDEGKITSYVDLWNPLTAMEALDISNNDLAAGYIKN